MKRILILAAVQVLAILSWASYHEYVWATAPTFRVPLRPRDPFDLLRGRYFVLNPQDEVLDVRSEQFPRGDLERLVGTSGSFVGTVQVGFCPVEDHYRVCALALPDARPSSPARFWTRAEATVLRREGVWDARLDLGLHRFFIPNRLNLPARERDQGWQVEVSYRPGLVMLPKRLWFKGAPIDLR